MVSLSKVLHQVESLERGRGLRLVGQDLKTRDRVQGREWFQLGRIWSQSEAVRLVEQTIDQALGRPGEGKKLLKEMGGVYRGFGARITPEQVIAVEARIKQRLQEKIGLGEQVHFSLLPTDLKFVSDCIRQDFAAARNANQMDPGFKTDGAREEIVIETEGVRRNLSDEASANFDNEADRLAYIVEALKHYVKDEGDDDAINERRFIFLTTFLSQRTILSAYAPTVGVLGGDVGPDKGDEPSGSISYFVINKISGDDGQKRFQLDCGCIKEELAGRVEGAEKKVLVKESSNLYLNIHIEISSEDLGKGNAEGVTVGPVDVSVQLTPDRRS